MKSEHVLLGVVAVLVVAALAVASVFVAGFAVETPLQSDDGFDETALRSFETTDARCADPNVHNSSSRSRPAPGGRLLSVTDSIAVESRDATVSARLDEFGPGRHVLEVSRDPGTGSADCHLEIRYNATLNLTRPNDYTLVVTHDDRLVGGHWGEKNGGGSFTKGRATERAAATANQTDANGASSGTDRRLDGAARVAA